MKDILFTVKQQKREIGYILASLFLAFGVNIYSIIKYNTEWEELYSQWLAMLVVAAIIYLCIIILRLFIWFIIRVRNAKGISQS